MNRHNFTISVNGAAVGDWESYEINQSMRQPASTCALGGPLTDERLKAVPLGAEVQVHIDRRPIFSGYITSRQRRGHRLEVQCHDRAWRLVRDSAPFVRLSQETLESFAKLMAGDVFGNVTFSNAKNRNLYGRGARRVGSEPPVINGSDEPVKVSPGATRWQALAEILRRADLLAWSSGNGKELVLAKPNFAQEPRYEFRISDTKRGTCIDIAVSESIEQSYRTVNVTGQSRVTPRSEASYGDGLGRKGTATDSTYPLPIGLRVVEEARSIQEATEMAAAYLADAKSGENVTTVQAFRHAQGDRFYAIDTVAKVTDERNGYNELVYVTGVTYSGNRTTEQTQLEAVPLNTRLVVA
jgi:prophage tail gpP-like protein